MSYTTELGIVNKIRPLHQSVLYTDKPDENGKTCPLEISLKNLNLSDKRLLEDFDLTTSAIFFLWSIERVMKWSVLGGSFAKCRSLGCSRYGDYGSCFPSLADMLGYSEAIMIVLNVGLLPILRVLSVGGIFFSLEDQGVKIN